MAPASLLPRAPIRAGPPHFHSISLLLYFLPQPTHHILAMALCGVSTVELVHLDRFNCRLCAPFVQTQPTVNAPTGK
jgi:hypothetical protein